MKKRIGSGLLAVSLVLSLWVAISPNANAATTTIYASDVLTEHGQRLVASMCGADIKILKAGLIVRDLFITFTILAWAIQ